MRQPTSNNLSLQIVVALTPKLVETHSGQKFGASEEGAGQCTLKFRDTMRPRLETSLRAWRSPWQNGYAERLIGSVRCECTDHLIAFNAEHLRRILAKYAIYYNEMP